MLKIKQLAFTLIELLVVIAIIGILSGLIVVSMGGMTNKATIAKAQVFSNSVRNSLLLNLVSEWKFDELVTATNGTVVQDSWSGGNSGTLSTNDGTTEKLKTGSDCVSGKCLSFDGTDDYVSYVDNSNLRPGEFGKDFTWCVWAKPNNQLNKAFLEKSRTIASGGSANPGFSFGQGDSSTAMRIEAGDGTNFSYTYWVNKAIVVGSWSLYCLTYDRDVGVYVYRDGNLITLATGDSTGRYTAINNNMAAVGQPFWVAKDANQGYYGGLIDDVRVFNASIPISQIKEQYYAGLNNLLASGSISQIEYLNKLNETAQK